MCCKAIKAANLQYLLYFLYFYFYNISHSVVTTSNVSIQIHLFKSHTGCNICSIYPGVTQSI